MEKRRAEIQSNIGKIERGSGETGCKELIWMRVINCTNTGGKQ